jgi:phosphate starvation-inducible membrane PsiE
MAAELNFSEYQAIRRRHQREEEDDAAEDAPPPAPPKKDGANEPIMPSESWSERAGAFAELHETQLVMTLLIVADLAASTFLLLFDCHGTAIAARLPAGAAKLLESFTGFTTFLFFFELCALVVAFQERFFLHPGYAIDVVVAALCLRAEIMLDGDKEVRCSSGSGACRGSTRRSTPRSARRPRRRRRR